MTADESDAEFAALRARIDAVDAGLVERLVERRALALCIGALKRRTGRAVVDAARESTVLARAQELSVGRLPAEELAAIYREILRMTRRAALGPDAARDDTAGDPPDA